MSDIQRQLRNVHADLLRDLVLEQEHEIAELKGAVAQLAEAMKTLAFGNAHIADNVAKVINHMTAPRRRFAVRDHNGDIAETIEISEDAHGQ